MVTQWDVNDYVISTMLDAYEELIVTQWDVNEDKEHKMKSLDSELIVTQWDVNERKLLNSPVVIKN